LCKNANLKIVKPIKKHFSKQRQPTCQICGVIGHIRPHCHQIQHQRPQIKKKEPKAGKSNSKPSKPHHAFRQKWQEWPHQGQILQREASQAQGNSYL
jgi:hypothetical protein